MFNEKWNTKSKESNALTTSLPPPCLPTRRLFFPQVDFHHVRPLPLYITRPIHLKSLLRYVYYTFIILCGFHQR